MTISKLLLACAFGSLSLAANAADLPMRSAPVAPAPAAGSWTGFYVGATTGYNFFSKAAGSVKPDGFSIGLRAGYDHQIAPSFVIGALVDADLDFGRKSISGTVSGSPYTGTVKHRDTISVDLKGGYVIDSQNMVYALAGFTHGQIKASATVASISAAESVTANGWNVGLGFEHRFTKQISGFAEYRFNQLKRDGSTVNLNQLKAGVAFRF